MKKEDRIQFVKVTEKMVTPKKVATVFQGAEFLRRLPLFLQKRIMEKGAKTDPYIGFIVEPYSLFLAYEVSDIDKYTQLLPEGYEPVQSAMFDHSGERNCVIIGAFNVHTSVFWGNRVEVYVIAKNKKTGLVSWIIHEYETNTISYDPASGFVEPGTKHSVLTTTCRGEIVLDMVGRESRCRIQVNADLKKGALKKLKKSLWIDGNLSVDYGTALADVQTKPFGLVFDPEEMIEAISISPNDIEIIENTFLFGVIGKIPFEVCCFPYAQHFYTTSIPRKNTIKNEDDLEKEIRKINTQSGPEGGKIKRYKRVAACPGYCFCRSCLSRCHYRKS